MLSKYLRFSEEELQLFDNAAIARGGCCRTYTPRNRNGEANDVSLVSSDTARSPLRNILHLGDPPN